MFLRFVCTVTLIAFLNSVIGCTSNVKFTMDEVGKQPPNLINSVSLVSGDVVMFDKEGGTIDVEREMIVGVTKVYLKGGRRTGGDPVEIKLSDVKYVNVRKSSPTKTAFFVVGSFVAIGIVAAIIYLSNWELKLFED